MAAEETGRRRRLEEALAGVEGWLTADEAWLLHEAARLGPRPFVVEIGAHKGRSTIALALGLQARGEGRVLSIDPYACVVDGESGDARRRAFVRNLEQAGVADRVSSRRSYSHDVAADVAPASVGALFVDGSHDYDDVLQDIDDWAQTMADGGLVLLNDPVLPSVSWALRDRVGRRGSPLRSAGLVANTLLTRWQPRAPWTRRDELRRLRLRAALPLGWRWVRLTERLGARGGARASVATVVHRSGRSLLQLLVPPPRLDEDQTPRAMLANRV